MGEPPSAGVKADGGALSRYLHAFRRKGLLATFLALPVAGAVAFAVWFYSPRTFTSTAVLRVAPAQSKLVFETADSAGNGDTFDAFKRTQRALLRSRYVITHALRNEALSKLPVFNDVVDPVAWLEKNLNVSYPDNSELMHVSLTARDSQGLDQLINAIVASYFQEIVFEESTRRTERLNDLELVYNQFESELRAKQTELKRLVEQTGGDGSQMTLEQQNAVQEYSSLNLQVQKLRFDIMQLEFELPAADAAETPAPLVSELELSRALQDDPVVQDLTASKAQLTSAIQATRNRFSAEAAAPKVIEFERQLEACDQQLAERKEQVRTAISGLKQRNEASLREMRQQEIARLRAQEGFLQEKLKSAESEVRTMLPRSSTDVEMMRIDIAGLQQVVSRLVVEIEQTKVELQPNSKSMTSRVKELSKALPAVSLDSSSRIKTGMTAGVAALGAVILVVLWFDVRNGHIYSAAEVSDSLGLNVIGLVPQVPKRIMRRLDDNSFRGKYWRSLLSESVDSVAAMLLKGAKHRGLRVVMVSSATSGEGKTTLAANLATSLAGAGLRTALVDFDLRRPALHRLFDVPLQPGIVDVLGHADRYLEVPQETLPNLVLFAAGRCNAPGLSLLTHRHLQELFDRLRTEFDFVVVDGSPILPVVDTRMIAQQADGVVLSVLRDVSRISQVGAACHTLQRFGVPILGVVVTGSHTEAYPTARYEPYVEAAAV